MLQTKMKNKMGEKDVMKECLCETCPTYADCKTGKKEKGFCIKSKSKCISKDKGCLCGACPVKQKMGFKHYIFCILGNEKQQK